MSATRICSSYALGPSEVVWAARYTRTVHKWDGYSIVATAPAGETACVEMSRKDQVKPLNPLDQQADRRHSDRFPIEREVRYKVLSKRANEEAGDGRTINISSSGVLFTTTQMLLPGKRMELAISWPAQLNNKTALRLVAKGRVVRFEQGRAAIEIQQYEFRTHAAAPAGAHPGPSLMSN